MGRKRPPGLVKRGGVWHIQKEIKGYGRLRESCRTDRLEEAEKFLAHRIDEIRLAVLYGVRPTRTFLRQQPRSTSTRTCTNAA